MATHRTDFVLIDGVWRLVVRHADRALRCRRRAELAAEERKRFEEAHSGLGEADSFQIAGFLGFLLSLPLVYFLDLFLLGVAAEYWAQTLFPHAASVALAARALAPAAMVSIELAVASQMYLARRRSRYDGGPSALAGWRIFGLVWASIAPAIVLSTQLIIDGATIGPDGIPAARWLLAAQVSFALLLHLFILFSGQLGHEAKGWAVLVARRTWISRKQRRAEERAATWKLRAVEASGEAERLREALPDPEAWRRQITGAVADVLGLEAGSDAVALVDAAEPDPEASTDNRQAA